MAKAEPTSYKTGVKLTQEAMPALETHVARLPPREQWLVDFVLSSRWG
jgi:hypothetical protein